MTGSGQVRQERMGPDSRIAGMVNSMWKGKFIPAVDVAPYVPSYCQGCAEESCLAGVSHVLGIRKRDTKTRCLVELDSNQDPQS